MEHEAVVRQRFKAPPLPRIVFKDTGSLASLFSPGR